MSFEQKLLEFADATKSQDIYDPKYKNGTWMYKAVETQETLEDFKNSSKNYQERKGFSESEIAGMPYISWSSVKIRKGDQRQVLSVVDFGDRRIAIDFDLNMI